eukprot:126463-Alexandrium_andersonii.AAC.1
MARGHDARDSVEHRFRPRRAAILAHAQCQRQECSVPEGAWRRPSLVNRERKGHLNPGHIFGDVEDRVSGRAKQRLSLSQPTEDTSKDERRGRYWGMKAALRAEESFSPTAFCHKRKRMCPAQPPLTKPSHVERSQEEMPDRDESSRPWRFNIAGYANVG